MHRIESTSELSAGMIVLTGTAFYLVTETFPLKFRGNVWSETDKAWGALRDVPLPSLTHPAHVVDCEYIAANFPTTVAPSA